MHYPVMILGGYGIFGQRIAQRLVQGENMHIILAGRNQRKAEAYRRQLLSEYPLASVSTQVCDVRDTDSLAKAVHVSRCQLIINTCGPFQARDYRCPVTVIKHGIHYIDLADARDYVCGFHKLHELARRYGVLALTGASSVPALSAAVIDALADDFAQLDTIDIGINPGNQTPRGTATVRSILSYCGKPFLAWEKGDWRYITGWQNLTRRSYPLPMGTRWLSNCEVPDLTLFQLRYPGVKTIRFQAGLELSVLHLGTWLLSWLVRWGWLHDAARYARGLKRISEWFYRFGSSIGGMHVELEGRNHQQQLLRRTWYLIARDGDGPQVPCTAAVILAEKFQRGLLAEHTGAYACMDFITLQEFEQEFLQHEIKTRMTDCLISARAADGQSPRLTISRPAQ